MFVVPFSGVLLHVLNLVFRSGAMVVYDNPSERIVGNVTN